MESRESLWQHIKRPFSFATGGQMWLRGWPQTELGSRGTQRSREVSVVAGLPYQGQDLVGKLQGEDKWVDI